MIRLTLNAQSDPEIHLFSKSTILLGADSAHVDLLLSGADIQPIHLKIVEQNGFPILINCANDPFVSVNGHPFGKKLLNSGDLIVVHQTTILFENLKASSEVDSSKEEALASLLENKGKKQEEATQQEATSSPVEHNVYFPSFSLPFEHEVEVLREDELQKGSLDAYLKELESFQEAPKVPLPCTPVEHKAQIEQRKKTASLKDDYLRDLDDDNHQDATAPFGHLAEPSHLYQAWKWILLFIFSLLAISGAIGTIIYFTVSDKTEAQETKAAQAVADIAIALTHAQLNHLKPHNQNWSDVDFLKSNLQAVLQDVSSYAAQIDAQGQFNCCPYSLRIYTSSDLSHFLLIAQPAPNLLYWLIPQSIIVVDSHLMELRTLKDVRSLNRLLANTDPLDGPNGREITNLVKQGSLIRLSSLAQDSGQFDFAPPKNVAWIRPGAENLIYNAPRYYRLGQSLIRKAISLSTSKGSSQEVAALKQDVENLHGLNHLILYSDQGKKSALLARQGLLMFAPSDKLLFGYLLFNAQGRIHQVHLLKDEEEWKDSSLVNLTKEKEGEIIAFQGPSEMNAKEDPNRRNQEESSVDRNHPIYIQLQSLVTARENELKPLISALISLMNQELQTPRPQFQIEFQNLSHSYLMADAKHKQALKESLDLLYHQYEDIPIHEFLAFVKELHLEQLIQQEDQSLTIVDENCQQNMETLLTQIENSKSLTELDNFIHIASTWLNFDYIKDPQDLMKYQNLLRNQLLEQLEKYLLSQKKHGLVKAEDKEVLQDILSQERLIKPEERDFFLEEFEELVASPHSEEIEEIADDD
jgi:hypothetical protein